MTARPARGAQPDRRSGEHRSEILDARGAQPDRRSGEPRSEILDARGAQPDRRSGEHRSEILDARGLRCPLPLVKAKLAMEELPAGDELLVLATDPEAAIDLAAWAADAGHSFEERSGASWSEYLIS